MTYKFKLCSIESSSILVSISGTKLFAVMLDSDAHSDDINKAVMIEKSADNSLTICYKTKIAVFYNKISTSTLYMNFITVSDGKL